ncbi:solute carrier family 32 (vesicular inhibitory amino acid transporter) [Blastomyces parvus]|uniref:Solute carrier family 32 (Vesicular inhibitory amino acid transporter) n=1 Tax=Blastomyces parvus TaxID=2060905 RepID=A0A2B7WKG5_9EURO|nr:solute carrier family 32 (vesicular inhibitory amino acid transporter) [Blastomyces parvus]PGG99863.1 solute carrier family 32 (vesicular inhibitory amino acid transporter) [Blastomyces parvus]
MARHRASTQSDSHTSTSSSSTPQNIPQHEINDNDLRRRWAAEISTIHNSASEAPNSFDNFARSWQRAAHFPEVAPRRSSFVLALPGDEEHGPGLSIDETRALLRQRSAPDERGLEPPFGEADYLLDYGTVDGEFDISTRTTPLLGRSYEPSYGTTVSSRISESARLHAAQLHREQQFIEADAAAAAAETDTEREPFLVKRIQHEDGSKEAIIVGQSTVPQTIFNSVNVLIGIGLLSLPLGLMYAGWLIGIPLLIFSAAATAYTAKILAKCMDVDPTLVTYADLAYISFGPHARIVTSLLFCLELMGACVALVVLFADSIDALIPGLGALRWKLICGAILIPMNFVPLRLLSLSSILGIFCCTSIVLIIFVDGIIKPESPGSLRDPARTSLLPENWSAVPLSFGLIMSPWGGHSVFPNIYKDMRHPHKYGTSLWVTYIFTFLLDLAMAVAGWLMFGPNVRDEITSNILLTVGYPNWLSVCIVAFIAIIPLTKVPLSCRPLVSTAESLCGLHPPPPTRRHDKSKPKPQPHNHSPNPFLRTVVQSTARILTICIITFIAIVFPYFDRIMAFIGASLCITICIILPVAFYLRIFGSSIPFWERVVDWVLLGVCSTMAVVGTAWAFIPRERIGLS